MKTITNPVLLHEEERNKLLDIVNSGNPKEILYANILLMSDKGVAPKRVSELLNTTKQTVNNVKQRYFEGGVKKCMIRKNAGKAPYPAKITGDVEAKIVALACSQAPKGRSKWTLQLLADKSVELKYIESITDVSVMTVLKKHKLSLT